MAVGLNVGLEEGNFEGQYHIITKIHGLTFISKETYTIAQVEQSGFIIEYSKDRDGIHYH